MISAILPLTNHINNAYKSDRHRHNQQTGSAMPSYFGLSHSSNVRSRKDGRCRKAQYLAGIRKSTARSYVFRACVSLVFVSAYRSHSCARISLHSHNCPKPLFIQTYGRLALALRLIPQFLALQKPFTIYMTFPHQKYAHGAIPLCLLSSH